MIESITRFVIRYKRVVITLWILAVVAFGAISFFVKPTWLDTGSLPGAESTKAYELAKKEIPEMASLTSDYSGRIVFQSNDGIAAHEKEITKYLDGLVKDSKITHVVDASSPFDDDYVESISDDGKVAFSNIAFSEDVSLHRIGDIAVARSAELRKSINVEFSGNVFTSLKIPASEVIGMAIALVILLFAFGSLVAAGMPLMNALVGVGVGISIVRLLSHVVEAPEPATNVSMMIAIGVGIDYALFIITRFRQVRNRGESLESSIVEAMNTSGSAVLFAGITVVISLLGLLIINLDFTTGMAVTTSAAVLVMIISALTFVPAVLATTIGKNIDKFSVSRKKNISDISPIWERWSKFVQRRAWINAIVGTLVLLVLAMPLLGLHIGISDEGNGNRNLTTRKAYDHLADGFGPGFNGPLLVIVDLRSTENPEVMLDIIGTLEKTRGVEKVFPSTELILKEMTRPEAVAKLLEEHQVVPVQVYPTTSPQDEKTADLVHTLRRDVLPKLLVDTGITAYVGGLTAGAIDFSDFMSAKMPWFLGSVLLLSFLLLMVVFRSVLVAFKAVIVNLLSIGASYGVIIAIFQWGWLSWMFGISQKGPIETWAPVMLFAILFGLSMDYEVFLLSKIKEEYDKTNDNTYAVTHGLAATARVITAAALIMVVVFGSFVLADERILKLMGLGLAVAVFLDATIVRVLLVPATMELLGSKNWWMPTWLDRILPRIQIERASQPVNSEKANINGGGEKEN